MPATPTRAAQRSEVISIRDSVDLCLGSGVVCFGYGGHVQEAQTAEGGRLSRGGAADAGGGQVQGLAGRRSTSAARAAACHACVFHCWGLRAASHAAVLEVYSPPVWNVRLKASRQLWQPSAGLGRLRHCFVLFSAFMAPSVPCDGQLAVRFRHARTHPKHTLETASRHARL